MRVMSTSAFRGRSETVDVRFSRSLYLREAIDRTAAAYSTLLNATVEEEGADVVVRVAGTPTVDLLDNFSNHALHETVRMRRIPAEKPE